MTKLRETGTPDMTFQARYPSATAFSERALLFQLYSEPWAVSAWRVTFTKKELSTKTGMCMNNEEQPVAPAIFWLVFSHAL